MNNRLALPALILLLLGLLALVLTGAMQELVVIPLLYLFWLMRVLFESIPQVVLWIGFLVIVAIVAWRSLAGPRPVPLARQPAPSSRAPVAGWATIFERATHDDYARQMLAQRLGQLAFELQANQERPLSESIWQHLHDESLDFPPDVRAYFQAGVRMYQPLPTFWRRWWARISGQAPRADPLDLDPEQVVRFLEEQMPREIRD
jgi:hypothetical protein